MSDVNLVLMTMKENGGAMRPGQIAEAAGLERKASDKALNVLKKDERVFSPKNCFWQAK